MSEYMMPEENENDKKQTNSNLSNKDLGGVDLPDNVQKWLLVVLVICLVGVIIWGKNSYEERIVEYKQEITRLENKDCSKEIGVYIELIKKIQDNTTTQTNELKNDLEIQKQKTSEYEYLNNKIDKQLK